MSQEAGHPLRALGTGTQRRHEPQNKLPGQPGEPQQQRCHHSALQTALLISAAALEKLRQGMA